MDEKDKDSVDRYLAYSTRSSQLNIDIAAKPSNIKPINIVRANYALELARRGMLDSVIPSGARRMPHEAFRSLKGFKDDERADFALFLEYLGFSSASAEEWKRGLERFAITTAYQLLAEQYPHRLFPDEQRETIEQALHGRGLWLAMQKEDIECYIRATENVRL